MIWGLLSRLSCASSYDSLNNFSYSRYDLLQPIYQTFETILNRFSNLQEHYLPKVIINWDQSNFQISVDAR